jgi:hypothetical protein
MIKDNEIHSWNLRLGDIIKCINSQGFVYICTVRTEYSRRNIIFVKDVIEIGNREETSRFHSFVSSKTKYYKPTDTERVFYLSKIKFPL